MKKAIITILSIAAILVSCSSPEKPNIYKVNTMAYLKANSNDPASIDTIEWSELKPMLKSYLDDSTYINLQKLKTIYFDSARYFITQSTNFKESDRCKNLSDSITNQLETFENNYPAIPSGKGYVMIVTLRAKNAFGALVKDKMIFSYDTVGNVIAADYAK